MPNSGNGRSSCPSSDPDESKYETLGIDAGLAGEKVETLCGSYCAVRVHGDPLVGVLVEKHLAARVQPPQCCFLCRIHWLSVDAARPIVDCNSQPAVGSASRAASSSGSNRGR